MTSIDLVLYFTREKARVFNISEDRGSKTVLELKSIVHEFIDEFTKRPENCDICLNLVDQEFTQYQLAEEIALIARCDYLADPEIFETEIEKNLVQNLQVEMKKHFLNIGINLKIDEKIENESTIKKEKESSLRFR